MKDYAKITDALRFTASEITNCNMVALSMRTLVDGAVAIEELMAQVRDKDYMIQQQMDEIERLRRDVKKQQEKMFDLAKKLPKRGEWIYEDLDNFRKYKVTCPHCGAWFVGNYNAYDEPSEFLYCPHCGNICNPTNLDWENELKEREKEVTEKMEETEDEVHSDI